MKNFWILVIRYLRFFISSMLGLILIIVQPIINLLKISSFRFLFVFLIITFIVLIFFIIYKMIGF